MFSAPNYCGSYKNKGAVILLKNQEMKIKQYKAVTEPYRLDDSGKLDGITWSLPFLADKIGECLEDILTRAVVTDLSMEKTKSTVEFELLAKQIKEGKMLSDQDQKIFTQGMLANRLNNVALFN